MVTNIAQEIEELAKKLGLVDWQKDRLLREYTKFVNMGYETSLEDIAKQLGFIDENYKDDLSTAGVALEEERKVEQNAQPNTEKPVDQITASQSSNATGEIQATAIPAPEQIENSSIASAPQGPENSQVINEINGQEGNIPSAEIVQNIERQPETNINPIPEVPQVQPEMAVSQQITTGSPSANVQQGAQLPPYGEHIVGYPVGPDYNDKDKINSIVEGATDIKDTEASFWITLQVKKFWDALGIEI